MDDVAMQAETLLVVGRAGLAVYGAEAAVNDCQLLLGTRSGTVRHHPPRPIHSQLLPSQVTADSGKGIAACQTQLIVDGDAERGGNVHRSHWSSSKSVEYQSTIEWDHTE